MNALRDNKCTSYVRTYKLRIIVHLIPSSLISYTIRNYIGNKLTVAYYVTRLVSLIVVIFNQAHWFLEITFMWIFMSVCMRVSTPEAINN